MIIGIIKLQIFIDWYCFHCQMSLCDYANKVVFNTSGNCHGLSCVTPKKDMLES